MIIHFLTSSCPSTGGFNHRLASILKDSSLQSVRVSPRSVVRLFNAFERRYSLWATGEHFIRLLIALKASLNVQAMALEEKAPLVRASYKRQGCGSTTGRAHKRISQWMHTYGTTNRCFLSLSSSFSLKINTKKIKRRTYKESKTAFNEHLVRCSCQGQWRGVRVENFLGVTGDYPWAPIIRHLLLYSWAGS